MAESNGNTLWTRDQTLIAFRLYCSLPFGKLNHRTPEIVELAERLGRTPSSVSMKACNFARLDPMHQARGVKGLPHGARLEEVIWNEFREDSDAIASEAESIYESLVQSGDISPSKPVSADESSIELPTGPTETERTVRARRVQGFFRRAVLSGYGHRCALTGLAIPELLNASHIIPWATPGSEQHRADPTNGLCLNALHDRAFDRGLISFDENHRLLVSPALAEDTAPDGLGRFADAFTPQTPLILPERFAPSPEALAYHREAVFQGGHFTTR